MKAGTYIPQERMGWWGGPDTRLRCKADEKVIFANQADADRSASKASARGTHMKSYKGGCGHWHTTRVRTR